MKNRFHLFPLLLFFIYSCNSNQTNEELENLKAELFKPVNDISELPLYADPPTSDYEDVKEGNFSFQIDSAKILLLKKYSKELEPLVLQRIDSGYAWVYLSAFLKYDSAVPKLRKALLQCNKFYGWEGGDYSTIGRFLDDEQYCYQMAYIAAIEYIVQKPIDKAITLTEEEKKQLTERAKGCAISDTMDEKSCSAHWLLNKLSSTKILRGE